MTISHLAVNADDTERSLTFYERVFGWRFTAWGPPGFYRMETGGAPELVVALQQRRALLAGERTTGFELTVSVPDVEAVVVAALEHGGRVVMEQTTIPGVGDLVWLADPSGNLVGAMRYEPRSTSTPADPGNSLATR